MENQSKNIIWLPVSQELLEAEYISLRTFRGDGEPIDTPVWCAWQEDRGYIFSAGNARKIYRIRAWGAAQVAPCGVRGKLHGEWHNAEACLLENLSEQQRAHVALRHKYGWKMKSIDFLAALSGRNKKRGWIELRLRTTLPELPEIEPPPFFWDKQQNKEKEDISR